MDPIPAMEREVRRMHALYEAIKDTEPTPVSIRFICEMAIAEANLKDALDARYEQEVTDYQRGMNR